MEKRSLKRNSDFHKRRNFYVVYSLIYCSSSCTTDKLSVLGMDDLPNDGSLCHHGLGTLGCTNGRTRHEQQESHHVRKRLKLVLFSARWNFARYGEFVEFYGLHIDRNSTASCQCIIIFILIQCGCFSQFWRGR